MTVTATREGERFSAFETFELITCYKCGMPFGVPIHWKQKRREDKGTFWCPNGHIQHYTKSRVDQLEDELNRRQRQLDLEKQRAEWALKQANATRRAHKRMRDRVKNGVCPCCNRTFQNLLAHMRSVHPEFGREKTLRSVREAFGLTQADLANEIGVNAAHISCFETGRSVTTWARDQIEAWLAEQQPA